MPSRRSRTPVAAGRCSPARGWRRSRSRTRAARLRRGLQARRPSSGGPRGARTPRSRRRRNRAVPANTGSARDPPTRRPSREPTSASCRWVATTAVRNPRSASTIAGTDRRMPGKKSASTASTAIGATRIASTQGARAALGVPVSNCTQPAHPPSEPTASSCAPATGPTTGTPGSANSAIQLPRRSCSHTSGAKSTAAGTSEISTRAAPRGRARAQATMPSTSAGTSTGAHAATTANTIAATPGRPTAGGLDHREHQRRQQDVRDHGTEVAAGQAPEEGRRERPGQRREARSPTSAGESCGAEPRAQGCERQGRRGRARRCSSTVTRR